MQAMHVKCNIKAHMCNQCCSGKPISITYAECVFVVVGIQYAMRLHHIVICGSSDFTKIFHIIS